MKNIILGDQIYEGVETVRLDTAEGGTVDYAPYDETFAAGRTEGYNAGIQSEYDRFWDAYQDKGTLGVYEYIFGSIKWNDDTFRPKYDIVMNGWSVQAFARSRITDLIASLERCGVILDTGGATSIDSMFAAAQITRIPEISALSVPYINGLCNAASQLVELRKLILKDTGDQGLVNCFNSCTSLATITFEGAIGQDINFQWSPLSVDSMKSVITHLKNYNGTADAGTKTVKFSDECWTTLLADGTTAPDGSTWRDYVETTLGWLT